MKAKQLAMAMTLAGLMMAGCESNPSRPGDPNNPSPTAGSDSSNKANDMADKAMYKPIEYDNKAIKGPTLVVIPGEIKSNNATFTQKVSSNNIADFAELELGNANFGILERLNGSTVLETETTRCGGAVTWDAEREPCTFSPVYAECGQVT